jgi:serine/threonine protein phosphatase PrpC
VKRCPTCGAEFGDAERFCEIDGSALPAAATSKIPAALASAAGCTLCGEGTLEADGFCTACGRRSLSSRPTPPIVAVGAPLARGVVAAVVGADEYVVREPAGAMTRVVLGDSTAIERDADVLERIGGTAVFPRMAECGVDETHGSFLAMASPPSDARPLGEVGTRLSLASAIGVVCALVDASATIEKLGFAWEPQRDDVHVRHDGSVRVSRVRVPRKLGPRERLDARAVVEAVGPTFVPIPALDGPPRVFRLFLPHVATPGEGGNSIEDMRRELALVERELAPPTDDGLRIAGVCDPGLRRAHNEDALSFASGTTFGERWSVLVVCDGVSSSSHAERASALASKTACDALAHFARSGDVAVEPGAMAVAQAIRAAHVAVCAQAIEDPSGDPPGTTIVVALVWRQRLTVGWVGDSRAYWVSESGAELLTEDHSWATEAVARGEVTEAEAMKAPLAHALTRCLGPLEIVDADAPDGTAGARIVEVHPDVRARDLPGAGWVVLCSDGFWNYFSPAADVGALVRLGAGASSPARIARRLVNHALARGGQDNTTTLVYEHR